MGYASENDLLFFFGEVHSLGKRPIHIFGIANVCQKGARKKPDFLR